MSCRIICSTKTRVFFTFYYHTVFAAFIICMHLLFDCTLCANKYWSEYIYIYNKNSHKIPNNSHNYHNEIEPYQGISERNT